MSKQQTAEQELHRLISIHGTESVMRWCARWWKATHDDIDPIVSVMISVADEIKRRNQNTDEIVDTIMADQRFLSDLHNHQP